MNKSLLTALAAAILALPAIPAAAQNMKPGLWEINNKMGGSGNMGAQMAADTDRHPLLADIRMAGAMDEPAGVAAGELLLGEADDEHRPVAVEEESGVGRGGGEGRHRWCPGAVRGGKRAFRRLDRKNRGCRRRSSPCCRHPSGSAPR